MSDLRYYRDGSKPLADRMRQAGLDNLESEELDGLLQGFARELRALGKSARQAHDEAENALEENCFDSEDLDNAAGTLGDVATALIGKGKRA